MKRAPTLIDRLYRASFGNDLRHCLAMPPTQFRDLLLQARRFVADDAMSTMMGELSTIAFTREKTLQYRERAAENLRVGARLPHAVTWIEYNLRKTQERSQFLLRKVEDPARLEGMPEREGWLLQRHPQIDTAFIAHIVTYDSRPDNNGYDTWIFPVAYAWTCDNETIVPWRGMPMPPGSAVPSELATGLPGYATDRVSLITDASRILPLVTQHHAVNNLIKEWIGVLRRIWAFLSTINDLPVLVEETRVSKGFVAKGQYRKFLSHKTITLTVPVTHYTKIARKALALAHRRGCDVRGHWRKDFRLMPSALCDHLWEAADDKHRVCGQCKGREVWVIDHQRGDASRGLVTHDYHVTAENLKKAEPDEAKARPVQGGAYIAGQG